MRGGLAAVPQAWWQALQSEADQPPAAPREPLRWGSAEIGSIEPVLSRLAALESWLERSGDGWEVRGADLSSALAAIAVVLRDAGLVRAWRDELLGVHDASGHAVGRIERGAVRLLGISTHAVHLAAWAPDGRFWLQQRAFDKPNDPGLWDTLVGGMVPAGESGLAALERETWEEAGLRFAQLEGLARGGSFLTRRPSAEVAHGYVVERLDWYRCVLPPGTVPVNQDGEVARFEGMAAREVARRLQQDEFTLEAALILRAATAGTA
ncbi:NUDIX domain-containing protein [Caenimonas sedimenti]|uniref:NUDIX domain-containing protein n=1 Tax=Caenimonas sedimenti TaxID=2596921 RepID=A0A562ZVL7_9BURK|nr:NUDIX domain-containing protein [Caenimonas sedimenti]TWO72345.1 NUDIX domain-containing protein [Caenimonas sedimenti]